MTRPLLDPSIPVCIEDCTVHHFGILDMKGRWVGARVTTSQAGELFGWLGAALRDGRPFGPITGGGGWHATREERDAAVGRYLRGARRRAEKAPGFRAMTAAEHMAADRPPVIYLDCDEADLGW